MSIGAVYPYLRVGDGAAAIGFYERVFGAEELYRLTSPDGRLGHAELRFGPATIMLSDAFPEYGIHAPDPVAGSGVLIHLHVEDADAMIARAEAEGARVVRPAADQFYGERSGTIRDPFGHDWMIGHHVEDVPVEEMQRRYEAMAS
jgi:PhnB protein